MKSRRVIAVGGRAGGMNWKVGANCEKKKSATVAAMKVSWASDWYVQVKGDAESAGVIVEGIEDNNGAKRRSSYLRAKKKCAHKAWQVRTELAAHPRRPTFGGIRAEGRVWQEDRVVGLIWGSPEEKKPGGSTQPKEKGFRSGSEVPQVVSKREACRTWIYHAQWSSCTFGVGRAEGDSKATRRKNGPLWESSMLWGPDIARISKMKMV